MNPYDRMVMARAKQFDLFAMKVNKFKPHFGGSECSGHPKTARPISTKDIMHVVLKSERARGKHSFLQFERDILAVAHRLAKQLGVRVYDIVVMGNHIHVSLRVFRRRSFQAYMRSFAGLVARKVLGAERNRPQKGKAFFKGRPFSRIVAAGHRSFSALTGYFELNRLEKRGICKLESRCLGLLYLSRADFSF